VVDSANPVLPPRGEKIGSNLTSGTHDSRRSGDDTRLSQPTGRVST